MSDTELQGIAQSDVLIRTAIVRSLERLYEDPSLIDHIFHSLAEDEETRSVYGEKQIELAKNWFLNSNIPVFMAFRVAEEQIPCITISLQESVEAEQTHGDVHYQPQEETAGDWPVLSDKFTPLRYSPASGIMVLPSGLMGDQLIAPGMFVVTRDGRKYQIVENLGDDEIALAPNTVGDFVNAVIKGFRKRYVTTIESVIFKETYQIGIHVLNEPAYLLYLHAIVKFCLLKYKQDLLEARGFERSVLSSTDFRRNQEFDVEEVFSRFINITGYVRQSWPKATKPMIDVVNMKDPDTNEGLVFSAVGDDTSDDEQSVNEEGKPPDSNDPWSVIPSDSQIAPTASTAEPNTPWHESGSLVLWTKGDYQLVDDGGGKMLTQGNAAAPTFNPGLREKGGSGGLGPTLGTDTLDGIPGTTWTTNTGIDVDVNLEPADGSGAVHLKDRNGVLFGYGVGETQTITWMAVVLPRLSPDFGGLMGGTVFRLGNTAGSGQLDLELIFRIFVPDLPPVGTESLTIFSNDWTDDFANAIYGPSTPAATYADKPLLLHYESGGRGDNQFYISGPGIGTMLPLALAPATLPVASGHVHQQSTYGTVDVIASHLDRWIGARFEDLTYDFKLSGTPAALTRTYAYLASRFPSLELAAV